MEQHCPPPVLFSELMETETNQELKKVVEELIAVKTITPERGKGKKNGVLNKYIEENLIAFKESIEQYGNDRNGDWSGLNTIFINLIETK